MRDLGHNRCVEQTESLCLSSSSTRLLCRIARDTVRLGSARHTSDNLCGKQTLDLTQQIEARERFGEEMHF